MLVIPWLGYQYILGMEDYLRRGQEQTVLGTAQALATALNERPELFNEGSYSPATRSEDLYVYPIYSPLSLVDASLNDWGAYQQYEVLHDNRDFLATDLNRPVCTWMMSRCGLKVCWVSTTAISMLTLR